jgi:signal transduction histidine kinase
MSHELRTPLNAVIGYSQLLLDDAHDEGEEEIARDLENIHGAGAHLLKLVNDILDYSKIEAGKLEVNFTFDNLKQRLGEVERLAGSTLAERNYTLEADLSQGDFVAKCDWGALTKGVTHVLLGAANATTGGSLSMTASRGADGASLIRIKDPKGALDGRPIEALFDIFTDDRDATPTKYGGAGIDLALGQKFLGVVGADIGVSHDPSGGRTFTISIPAEVSPASQLALAS